MVNKIIGYSISVAIVIAFVVLLVHIAIKG